MAYEKLASAISDMATMIIPSQEILIFKTANEENASKLGRAFDEAAPSEMAGNIVMAENLVVLFKGNEERDRFKKFTDELGK